ncbi:MAG: ATP-binding protein [Clostridia bacterium]|nr:ATP-binding protein [Clostridia bacterium]
MNENIFKLGFDIKGGDFSAAGEASSKTKKTLKQLGIDSHIIRRVAIATYETEMNIVIHADEGRMEIDVTPERIIIYANDRGPGIESIELAMKEGYSTAPDNIRELGFGAGMGLPNMKKCSDSFDIKTKVGEGTKIKMVINLNRGDN